MLKGAVNVQTVNGHTGVNHLFKVSKCEFSHHPFDSFILSLAPFKNDKVSSLRINLELNRSVAFGWLVGFLKGREVTLTCTYRSTCLLFYSNHNSQIVMSDFSHARK